MQTTSFDGDNILHKDLPQPTGWQILLAPIKVTEQTSGGIILVQEDVKAQEGIRFVSKVLAMGPLAYTGNKFKAHPEAKSTAPWCKVGDVVSTGQYAGSQIPCKIDGDTFYLRLVSDDEVKTVIPTVGILNV